jgi:hypothetical protein
MVIFVAPPLAPAPIFSETVIMGLGTSNGPGGTAEISVSGLHDNCANAVVDTAESASIPNTLGMARLPVDLLQYLCTFIDLSL